MVVHMLILITRLLYSLKGIQGRRNMGGRGGGGRRPHNFAKNYSLFK